MRPATSSTATAGRPRDPSSRPSSSHRRSAGRDRPHAPPRGRRSRNRTGGPAVRSASDMFAVGFCANGKYSCTRCSASRPSWAVCSTTPTTEIHSSGLGLSPNAMRLPIGSLVGQNRLTLSSSTTTTFAPPARSVAAMVRPADQPNFHRFVKARRDQAHDRPTDSASLSAAGSPRP